MVQTRVRGVDSSATARVNAKVSRLTLRFALASVRAVRHEGPGALEGEEELLALVVHRMKSLWHGVEAEGGPRESRWWMSRTAGEEVCGPGDSEERLVSDQTREWQRVSRAEVAQVGQSSRTSEAAEAAQRVEARCVSVGETERYSSLRSIRMRQSQRRRPMARLEAHAAEREAGAGKGALEVVEVDQLGQGQTKWQNVEWVGVSQGQPFLLYPSKLLVSALAFRLQRARQAVEVHHQQLALS
jgi:hypothetical protein